jgi:hypothetical protein
MARVCECVPAGGGAGQGGGGAVCVDACARVRGCAGAFQTASKQIERNPASGWFNVFKRDGKWVGEVRSRGVYLRTSGHAEAWRAAAELEWLLDRWCREHGAWAAAEAVCMLRHHACGRVCAGVARSELVSNLPQLRAAGHVDAEGRLVVPVLVVRLRTLPAPRLGAPQPLVRVRPSCRRWLRGAPTRRCVAWVRRCR